MKKPLFLAFLFFLCCKLFAGSCNYSIKTTPLSNRTFQFVLSAEAGTDSFTHFRWLFGDGDSAFIEAPLHTFPDTGNYYICLIADNFPSTCDVDTCFNLHIDTCQANFSFIYYPDTLQPEAALYFFNNASFNIGSSATWLWSFDNGDFSVQPNVAYTFEEDDAGVRNVCLTVTDNTNHCTSTHCENIVVEPLCPATRFSYSVSGNTVTFNALVCGDVANIAWNFGDGTSIAHGDSVMQHTYAAGDSFYVQLDVTYHSVCEHLDSCAAIFKEKIYLLPTGIEESEMKQLPMEITPNPATSFFTVQTGINGESYLRIMDASGRLAASERVSDGQRMDISTLPKGIYMVQLKHASGLQKTVELVKQ